MTIKKFHIFCLVQSNNSKQCKKSWMKSPVNRKSSTNSMKSRTLNQPPYTFMQQQIFRQKPCGSKLYVEEIISCGHLSTPIMSLNLSLNLSKHKRGTWGDKEKHFSTKPLETLKNNLRRKKHEKGTTYWYRHITWKRLCTHIRQVNSYIDPVETKNTIWLSMILTETLYGWSQ